MSLADRFDPALRHLLEARTNLAIDVLPAVRAGLDQRRRDEARSIDVTGVGIEAADVAGIAVRIYRGAPHGAPVVIYCHSGAFVLGNLDTDHRQCVELARRGRCTVISVDYRLAPEHPFPAAFDDATTVLDWVVANAGRLAVDADRLAVAGSSAGGALAAGLAQHHASRVVFQLLHQPVLDDRPTPSSEEFDSTPGFDGPAVAAMWRHYLPDGAVPVDAVPARRTRLGGVPNALITCSELDPLRDEAIEYAAALLRSGVGTELHVFAGTCHGFDALLPHWETTRQLYAMQGDALRRALATA